MMTDVVDTTIDAEAEAIDTTTDAEAAIDMTIEEVVAVTTIVAMTEVDVTTMIAAMIEVAINFISYLQAANFIDAVFRVQLYLRAIRAPLCYHSCLLI